MWPVIFFSQGMRSFIFADNNSPLKYFSINAPIYSSSTPLYIPFIYRTEPLLFFYQVKCYSLSYSYTCAKSENFVGIFHARLYEILVAITEKDKGCQKKTF